MTPRPQALPRILVVAAIMQNADGKILLCQRPKGKAMAGYWEFPGGKVEAGESCREALVRELAEELAITAQPEDLTPLTFADHPYEEFNLLMPLYHLTRWHGVVQAVEHTDICWVLPKDLHQLPKLLPADEVLIEPLVHWLG